MENQIELQLNTAQPGTPKSTRSLALVPPPETVTAMEPIGPGETIAPEMAAATARLIQGLHLDYGLALPREQELPMKIQRWALQFTRCNVPASELEELYHHVSADKRKEGKFLDFPPTIHRIIAKYEEIYGAELRRVQEISDSQEAQRRSDHWSKQPAAAASVGFGAVKERAAANMAKAGGR